jgi:hypothetical protein
MSALLTIGWNVIVSHYDYLKVRKNNENCLNFFSESQLIFRLDFIAFGPNLSHGQLSGSLISATSEGTVWYYVFALRPKKNRSAQISSKYNTDKKRNRHTENNNHSNRKLPILSLLEEAVKRNLPHNRHIY